MSKYITYLFFSFIILFNISCQQNIIVTARVDRVFTQPWRTGNILYYSVSFYNDGRIDSTYIIGNKIYRKGTDIVFFFVPGDSIKVKLSIKPDGLYQFNKFIGIQHLEERQDEVKQITIAPESSEKLIGINHVDKFPLLPDAKTLEDNKIIIINTLSNELKEQGVALTEPVIFYLKIDSLGKARMHKIYSEDAKIIDAVNNGIEKLPLFSPAIKSDRKVNVITSFEIKNK